MKKLVLLITGLTIVVTSFGQTTGGLKAGLNLSTFGGDAEEVKLRLGFHIGGYMNFAFNEKLSLQPELLLNTAGGKFEEKEDGFSYESTTKLTYLSIPLSLQYSFGRFNIHAGPQVSFLMGAKDEYTETYNDAGNTITESGEEDIKEYLTGVDLGLNFGVGLSFGKLGLCARYSFGLSNVLADGEDDGEKLTNNAIQISAMYKLFGK